MQRRWWQCGLLIHVRVMPLLIRLHGQIIRGTWHVWVRHIELGLGLIGISIGVCPPIMVPGSVLWLQNSPRRLRCLEGPRLSLTITLGVWI